MRYLSQEMTFLFTQCITFTDISQIKDFQTCSYLLTFLSGIVNYGDLLRLFSLFIIVFIKTAVLDLAFTYIFQVGVFKRKCELRQNYVGLKQDLERYIIFVINFDYEINHDDNSFNTNEKIGTKYQLTLFMVMVILLTMFI